MIDNQNGDFHSFSSFTQLGYMLKRLAQQDSYIKANAVQGEKGDTGAQGLECYYIYSSDNLSQNFNIPFSDFNRAPVAGENFICFSVDNNTNISYISKCNIISISGENAVCSIIEKSAINSTAVPSGGKQGTFLRKITDQDNSFDWGYIVINKNVQKSPNLITNNGNSIIITFTDRINFEKISNIRIIIAIGEEKIVFLNNYLGAENGVYFQGVSVDNKNVLYECEFHTLGSSFNDITIKDAPFGNNGDYSITNIGSTITQEQIILVFDEINY